SDDAPLLLRLQHRRETDAEPVRVSDGEIPEAVVAIADWNNDSYSDLLCQLPMVVHLRNHHPDVCERKPRRRGQLHMDPFEGRGLSKKKPVIFPGQFHEIATVAKQREAQSTIELGGTPDVADDDFGHQLLCRIDVSTHGANQFTIVKGFCAPSTSMQLRFQLAKLPRVA